MPFKTALANMPEPSLIDTQKINQLYQSVGIAALSPNQLYRLRKGHRVRIKLGKAHNIHLSSEQIKKLYSAHKKGKAITVIFDPYQIEAHGKGIFGDIAKSAKSFIQKHNLQSIVNPLIQGAKKMGHRGINRLSGYAHSSLDKLNPIEGNGIIGDVLGMVNPTMGTVAKTFGLGVARKHSTTPARKTRKPRGRGVIGDIAKTAAKAVAKKGIEIGANYLNNKVDGLGVVKPKLMRRKTSKKSGRGYSGAALYPAGYSVGQALFPA